MFGDRDDPVRSEGIDLSEGSPAEDAYVLDIIEPTTSRPTSTFGRERLAISFSFMKGSEAVDHELADIRLTDVTLGGRACLTDLRSNGMDARVVSSLPDARAGMDAASVRGKAYVVGGRSGPKLFDSIVEFDPVASSARVVYRLSTPISTASVVSLADKVYILGGIAPNTVLSTIRVYDPIANTSYQVGDLPEPRAWGAAAVAQGMIFYGGGFDEGLRRSDSIFRFDPSTGDSRQVHTLPSARVYLAATSAFGKVYFIGGNVLGRPISEIVEYDPVAHTSAVVATFPSVGGGGLEAQTATTLNGRVYMFNGWGWGPLGGERSEVFEFDPKAGRDAVLVGMLPHQIEWGAAAGINGKAYLFGGMYAFYVPISAITEFTPPGTRARFSPAFNVWRATCTVPAGLYGPQDLFVQVEYTDHATNTQLWASDKEVNAVVITRAAQLWTGTSRTWLVVFRD